MIEKMVCAEFKDGQTVEIQKFSSPDAMTFYKQILMNENLLKKLACSAMLKRNIVVSPDSIKRIYAIEIV